MSKLDGKSRVSKAIAGGVASLGTGTPIYFVLPDSVEPAWLKVLVFPINFVIGFALTYWAPKNAE